MVCAAMRKYSTRCTGNSMNTARFPIGTVLKVRVVTPCLMTFLLPQHELRSSEVFCFILKIVFP